MATPAEPQSPSSTDESVVSGPQKLRVVTVTLGSGPKFLDAHVTAGVDFNVVTRSVQINNTQRWLLRDMGAGLVTIQQLSGGRYLDAHESDQFRVVTRPKQNNNTQRWRLINFGGSFFKIQQVSSNRVLQAEDSSDSQVVTRPEGGADLQVWRILDDELIAE